MQLTLEQLLLGGALFLITSLLGVVTFFLRRVLSSVDHLDVCIDSLKLKIEREFISVTTFETARSELRDGIIDLWKADAEKGRILAKVEAHIDIASTLRTLLTKGN